MSETNKINMALTERMDWKNDNWQEWKPYDRQLNIPN